MINTISCQQVAELQRQGRLDLIDVRTPMEFAEVHAVGARNIPLDQLNVQAVMAARNGTADEPLYVICRSGSRANRACSAFLDAGFSNIVNLEGGTQAWIQAGLPVQRAARPRMSLERQVRIAAGFLTLLGAVLAVTVHPWFIGLSGFVGAGLMFAGITDTCGMGLMLAKAPWNQVSQTDSADAATCRRNWISATRRRWARVPVRGRARSLNES